MKVYLFLSFLFILLSCERHERIQGHWHLKGLNIDLDFTMDVFEDSIAIIGVNSSKIEHVGRHSANIQNLFFPAECGSMDYDYKITGNFIELNNQYGSLIGFKTDSTTCNKHYDFSSSLRLFCVIPNPVLDLNKKMEKTPAGIENAMAISIGKPKRRYSNYYEDDLIAQIGEELINIDSLETLIDNLIEFNTSNNLDTDNVRLFIHEEVKGSVIRKIKQMFKSRESVNLWIAYLKPNYKNELRVFNYLNLNDLVIDDDITISEVFREL